MCNRLLIVDDEPVTLLAFRRLLSGPGMEVDTAETLSEALQKIENQDYVAVIADLRLTGVLGEEGLEILKRVKLMKSNTRFILMTGYGSDEIRERAMRFGADFYIEKPVSCGTLRDALGALGVGD